MFSGLRGGEVFYGVWAGGFTVLGFCAFGFGGFWGVGGFQLSTGARRSRISARPQNLRIEELTQSLRD